MQLAIMKRPVSVFPCCLSLILLAATACQHGPQAQAHSEPGSAHAAVDVRADAGAESRYEPANLARTGVTIEPDLARQCRLVGGGEAETETFFAFDSTLVTSVAHDVLSQLATCVTDGQLRGRALVLVGHTDPRGSDTYNKELGINRAESVANFLRHHGVEPTKLEIHSVGEAAASTDPDQWPIDRRVELSLKSDASARR